MFNIGKAVAALLLVVVITPNQLKAQDRQDNWTTDRRGTQVQPKFDGKPLSDWIKAVHDRDEATMPLALDAIRIMGPSAKAAVPELTRLLSDPFRPIQLGKDSDTTIATKLDDIEVRSAAIDALASIGKAADAFQSWQLLFGE